MVVPSRSLVLTVQDLSWTVVGLVNMKIILILNNTPDAIVFMIFPIDGRNKSPVQAAPEQEARSMFSSKKKSFYVD